MSTPILSLLKRISILKRISMFFLNKQFSYHQDGLFTSHNSDFMQDPRFISAYAAGDRTGSWRGSKIHWRAFVACWAANKGMSLEGDFVECGVNRGGLAMTVLQYCSLQNDLQRKFYLLDTFNGLVEKYIQPEEKTLNIKEGGYEECFDAVKKTFENYSNVVIIRGAVPETLQEVTSSKIAYLSIDMNCVEP